MHREKERGREGWRENDVACGKQRETDIRTDKRSRGLRSCWLSPPLRSGCISFPVFGSCGVSLIADTGPLYPGTS